MQHLLPISQEISQRIKTAKKVMLLCDYDGTLTAIVERPELADLPEKTRQLLRALASQGHFALGIISGRALADLKKRVNVDGIIYAGNHGLEIEGPGIWFTYPLAEEMRPVFRLIHQILTKAVAPIRGVQVENKGLTLTVHYRMVEEEKSAELKTIFEMVLDTAISLGKIRTTQGKKVYEVRPAVDWDKGKAISLIIDEFGKKKMKGELLPIFLGDDQTDEDGFKVVEKHNGISIFVGDNIDNSAARYFLKSSTEVEEFLNLLLQPYKMNAK